MTISQIYIRDSLNKIAAPPNGIEAMQILYMEPFLSKLFRGNRPQTFCDAQAVADHTLEIVRINCRTELGSCIAKYGHASALSTFATSLGDHEEGLLHATTAIMALDRILQIVALLDSFYWRHSLSLVWGGCWFPTFWRLCDSTKQTYDNCLNGLRSEIERRPNAGTSMGIVQDRGG